MTTSTLLAIVVVLAVLGYILGTRRAIASAGGSRRSLHSRPSYHGAYTLIWAAVPALALLAVWNIAQPFYLDAVAQAQFPSDVQEDRVGLQLNTVQTLARAYEQLAPVEQDRIQFGFSDARTTIAQLGIALPGEIPQYTLRAARDVVDARAVLTPVRFGAVIAVAVIGLVVGLMLISPHLRARNLVERFIRILLMLGATIAILTTFGIVMSLASETLEFFTLIPPADFFFSTTWDPGFQAAGDDPTDQDFGLLPLLWGTLYISFIALLIAVPVGLMAAVYMAEFASSSVRSVAKPLLEVLAGIPTIVYGFFALVTVGPFIRDTINLIPGMTIGASSVATAGVVMGIMIIPFVSSLSDDIINAVPRSLRDGSLGLGATKAETVRLVILPAALPGIVGAVLLAASRAIGETMIVVLAAGATAKLSFNPFEAMTTVTVKIVSQLTGDVEFTSAQALVAFALGSTLFVVTLIMNIIALRIVRKYREQYE